MQERERQTQTWKEVNEKKKADPDLERSEFMNHDKCVLCRSSIVDIYLFVFEQVLHFHNTRYIHSSIP